MAFLAHLECLSQVSSKDAFAHSDLPSTHTRLSCFWGLSLFSLHSSPEKGQHRVSICRKPDGFSCRQWTRNLCSCPCQCREGSRVTALCKQTWFCFAFLPGVGAFGQIMELSFLTCEMAKIYATWEGLSPSVYGGLSWDSQRCLVVLAGMEPMHVRWCAFSCLQVAPYT